MEKKHLTTEGPDSRSAVRSQMPWRRAAVACSVVAGMLLTGLAAGPSVLLSTTGRDELLNQSLKPLGLHAKSGSARGGWYAPLVFRDVAITDADGRLTAGITEIRFEKSLLQLLADARDLGEVLLSSPDIRVELDDDGNFPALADFGDAPPVRCRFRLDEASVRLIAPWRKLPVVDLNSLDVTGYTEKTTSGEMLVIEPISVFSHAVVSPEHSEQNLALIAPILAQTTILDGRVSLVTDEVRIPLNSGDSALSTENLISGTAVFHSVDARLRSAWAAQIAGMVGRSADRQLPDRLRIARDSRVSFRVDADGIHHDGLVLLLPDLSEQLKVNSHGTVGLDETLDLTLAMQFPDVMIRRNPLLRLLTAAIAEEPFRVQVAGTVDAPELRMPPGFSLASELESRVVPAEHRSRANGVSQAVFDLVRDARDAKEHPSDDAAGRIAGGIFGLIRTVREARQEQEPSTSEADHD